MKSLTLLKANIKHRKSGFIGILVLIFIISISLAAVITIWHNSRQYEMEQMDRVGYGEITSWVRNVSDINPLIRQLEAIDEVDTVKEQDIIYVDYEVNGKKSDNFAMLANDADKYPYHLFQKNLSGLKHKRPALQSGEVYVSPAFRSIFGAGIGDKVSVFVTGNIKKNFIIKGFFEDPFTGSSMMGMKTILIGTKDMKELTENLAKQGNDKKACTGAMLHIFKKSNSTISSSEFHEKINKQTDILKYARFTHHKSQIFGFMLILQNIFAGFLMVFVFVLIIAAMIAAGHNISSSIEQDYTNLGILKAVGYTKKNLRHILILQYLGAVLGGMFLGLPLSIFLIKLVNHITVSTTGVLTPSSLPIGICLAFYLAVLLLLMSFISFKTIKIGKITPIGAIRGGVEDVYFKSRITLPIRKKGLNFWLALRQLTAGKRQYISAGVVTALLVFFVTLVGRIDAWMGPGGKGMMTSFSAVSYDIGVMNNMIPKEKIENTIGTCSKIDSQYQFVTSSVAVDGIDYMINVVSDPNQYHVLQGRICKYDNEILITEFVAQNLNVGIGDTVTVKFEDKSAKYIVSGINQCANDMGDNCSMNLKGFERITNKKIEMYTNYILKNPEKKDAVVKALEHKYKDKIEIDKNTWSGLDGIVKAMKAIEFLMYIIVMVFILVVTVLTGSKILYKEQKDLGIYKSLGFHSKRLRLTFALRFGIVACIGSVFGVVGSALITDPMVTAMLKMCGISHFVSSLNLWQMLMPAVLVIVFFVMFAFLASGRIKKVDPAILITE